MSLDLSPQPEEEVLAFQSQQLRSKIYATMKIMSCIAVNLQLFNSQNLTKRKEDP